MMRQLRRSLEALSKNLKALSVRAEKMTKVIDKLEKAQAKAGTGRKAVAKKVSAKKVAPGKVVVKKVSARKVNGPSATATILSIVNRSKKGVDTATLRKETGYNNRKIWDIVHRAYKEGKIKKVASGVYIGGTEVLGKGTKGTGPRKK